MSFFIRFFPFHAPRCHGGGFSAPGLELRTSAEMSLGAQQWGDPNGKPPQGYPTEIPNLSNDMMDVSKNRETPQNGWLQTIIDGVWSVGRDIWMFPYLVGPPNHPF